MKKTLLIEKYVIPLKKLYISESFEIKEQHETIKPLYEEVRMLQQKHLEP